MPDADEVGSVYRTPAMRFHRQLLGVGRCLDCYAELPAQSDFCSDACRIALLEGVAGAALSGTPAPPPFEEQRVGYVPPQFPPFEMRLIGNNSAAQEELERLREEIAALRARVVPAVGAIVPAESLRPGRRLVPERREEVA